VVAEEGWTKAAMDKMYKIDSFIRETQRLDGLGLCSLYISLTTFQVLMCYTVSVSVARLTLQPFTFSNGVTVPPGVLVAAPACATHTDEEVYTNPDKFEGFRFSKLRGSLSDGDAVTNRHQVVSISPEHLPFGLGRHAW
jgi:cytochrome P450